MFRYFFYFSCFLRATLFSCCTFLVLHSFHVALSSCCIRFILHFSRVVIFSCCSFSLLHYLYAAYLCCTLFMLNFLHVFMLKFLRVALFSYCTVMREFFQNRFSVENFGVFLLFKHVVVTKE